jgi:excisionase family DNA binding protein
MTNAKYDIGITRNFLTIQGVSQYLGIKPKTIYARVKEIPHYKVGRLIRFKREDVDAWMERHRVAKKEKEQDQMESATPATRPPPKPPKDLRSRKRKGPIADIDRMISKAIDQVKGESYTASHGKSDRIEGLGKEVDDGSL